MNISLPPTYQGVTPRLPVIELAISYLPAELTPLARAVLQAAGRPAATGPEPARLMLKTTAGGWPEIRVKSRLTFAERVRRFGVDGQQFASEQEMMRWAEQVEHIYYPAGGQNYGIWRLHGQGAGRANTPALGTQWLNERAAAFCAWCQAGGYELPADLAALAPAPHAA